MLEQIFDLIIVGAGPAGCVLANRLSEVPGRTVLLIEAGPDATVPGAEHADLLDPFCMTASSNAMFHWPGLTAEVLAGQANGANATLPYLQGYGVGGASNINGMGVDRGHPDDYDEWNRSGASGWGWHNVLPYFRKLEHDLDFATPTLNPMHGDTGLMPVRRLTRARWAPFTRAVAQAIEKRGYPFIDDYNADWRDGFSSVPTNCLPQRRVSASMAYLSADVRSRPNLTILPQALVDKLIVRHNRVEGVLVRGGGALSLLTARQVILACGAIQSPTLLMRSGIGPGAHLQSRGIEVVHELPGVGANLQNHPQVTLATYLAKDAAQSADNPYFLQNWLRFSSGHAGCAANDMHLMPFNKCGWHELGARVGAVVITVLKSYSKGRIELSSADPATQPRVAFNSLSDPRDFDRLVNGLRFALELLSDAAVQRVRRQLFIPDARLVASFFRRTRWNAVKARVAANILDRSLPRRLLLKRLQIDPQRWLNDRQALSDYVRAYAQPQYHVCGTCRMGQSGDRDAVVDSAGRVHGMEALRVVDASIFPTIPRGYTHFIVLMAAEKLADAVKAAWQLERTANSSTGARHVINASS